MPTICLQESEKREKYIESRLNHPGYKIPIIGLRLFCDTLLEVPEEFKAALYPGQELSV
jgi:hypothetical protein